MQLFSKSRIFNEFLFDKLHGKQKMNDEVDSNRIFYDGPRGRITWISEPVIRSAEDKARDIEIFVRGKKHKLSTMNRAQRRAQQVK